MAEFYTPIAIADKRRPKQTWQKSWTSSVKDSAAVLIDDMIDTAEQSLFAAQATLKMQVC